MVSYKRKAEYDTYDDEVLILIVVEDGLVHIGSKGI